jgi:uncharacterized membrane protein
MDMNKPAPLPSKIPRIDLIDGLRGLSLVLMVVHHLLYDLAAFAGLPWWVFTNPVLDVAHYVFAGVFVALSGVSSRFSHSNIKRGVKTALCALLITGVTFTLTYLESGNGTPFLTFLLTYFSTFEGESYTVVFGILHLLALCMLLYGVFGRWLNRVPAYIWVVLWVLCLTLLRLDVISAFPFFPDNVYSADWFPPLPWVFVFMWGTSVGGAIKAGTFPQWFYERKTPVLAAIGRKSLWIYLLHQPLLLGATQLGLLIFK